MCNRFFESDYNISSVVEFQRCWVLKSKLFGQESTFSKETLKKISFYELRFIKKCQNSKGKIVSKRFFLAKDSSKKRTKTRHILVKTNSFVRFLEESSA